jgi:NADH-quinone oxidoreductase subunit M
MASKTSQPISSGPERPGRPTWVGPTFFALGLIIVVVALTQLLGASDKDRTSFSAANAALGAIVPVLVAAAVGALVPRGHGWSVRFPLAVMSALFAIFLMRMWPSSAAVVTEADLAAPTGESSTILSWLIGLPLAGAVAILFLPRQSTRLLKGTTFVIMLGTLFATVPLMRVEMGRTYHFNQDVVWIERFGIHYHVALDGISLWLVILTAFIVPIATYVSFGPIKTRIKDWCFALLLLEAAMIGAFVALDLFLFYVFWELMLVPMYVIIGVWGGTNRIKASLKFFLYTMAGSMLMLAAILYLAYTYGKITGGPTSFDYFELQRVVLPRNVQIWLFIGFAASFLIKVPMFPVHTWLPDAHTEAPTAGSIILAAVLLKMGTYGYLRFCMGLFPEASSELAATLAGVAVLGGILYGALCAWRQDDLKRLVAYSSVAHLGYVMLGLFAGTQSSMEGAILQMVNHGVSTGALFLLVGVIYDRRHTRMFDDFGGLAKVMPIYAALFVIATMSSIGLPGTNGFTGEFLIIVGTFTSNKLGHVNGIQAVGAALGVILAALYMLTAVQKMFFGPITRDENRHLKDINTREILAVAPLIIAIFVLGLAPNILLSQMRDAVARTISDVSSRTEASPAPAYYRGPFKLVARRPDAPKLPAPANATPSNAAASPNGGDSAH